LPDHTPTGKKLSGGVFGSTRSIPPLHSGKLENNLSECFDGFPVKIGLGCRYFLARYWRYFFLVVEHNYFWKYIYFGFYLYLSYGFAKTVPVNCGLAKLEKMRLLASQFLWKLNGVCLFSILLQNRCDNTDNDYYFIKLIFVCILFFKKIEIQKIISQSKSYCLKEKASSSWVFTNNKRIIDFAVYLFNSNLCWENRRFRSRFYTGFTLLNSYVGIIFYCNEYGFSEIVFY
jgi:hypothetical protein